MRPLSVPCPAVEDQRAQLGLDGTLLDYDYREVRVSQAILRNARRVLLAADHSKFGRPAMVRMDTVRDIHALFTDQAPPEPVGRLLAECGVEVHVAGPTERADDRSLARDGSF